MSIGSSREDPSASTQEGSAFVSTSVASDSSDSGSISGSVKWFDVKKGFGFIVGPEGQDVFVHFSSIRSDGFRTLKDGEAVQYELHQGDKGYHALNVHRLPSSGAKANPRPAATASAAKVSRATVSTDGDGWRAPASEQRSSRMRNLDGYVG